MRERKKENKIDKDTRTTYTQLLAILSVVIWQGHHKLAPLRNNDTTIYFTIILNFFFVLSYRWE
jgi:hypothetical protein